MHSVSSAGVVILMVGVVGSVLTAPAALLGAALCITGTAALIIIVLLPLKTVQGGRGGGSSEIWLRKNHG
jgi:hypothetical protein